MRSPDQLPVTVQPGVATTALVYPADDNSKGAVLILGHGAGASQHSPWIVDCAGALSGLGLTVVTFKTIASISGVSEG